MVLLRNKQRGFTLTEAAIVLGVVGLILAAIWIAAGKVYTNLRASQMNEKIIQTVQSARSLYAQQTSVASGDQTANMITAGVAPKDLVNSSGTTLTNPWMGAMFIGGTGDGLGFVVELTNVPQESCMNLVSIVGGVGRDAGLTMAQGGSGATYAAVATVGTPLSAPIAPTPAATGCVAGVNRVTFVYTMR